MTSPIISVEELDELLGEPGLIVFDVRSSLADPQAGARAFEAGHIPQARFVAIDSDVSGPHSGSNGRHPLIDSGRFCVNMRRLGLNPGNRVVIYDQGECNFAARLWFTLRWIGFSRVSVLSGGWRAYEKAGLPVSTASSRWDQGTIKPSAPLERVFGVDFVLANLKTQTHCLLDARAADRFLGKNETMDAVAGHIPGARSRPSRDNLDADGLIKPRAQLREEFLAAMAPASPEQTVNMCGSGITACCNHLCQRYAGLEPAGVYIGSWSEWISDETRPVSTNAP